MTRALPIMQVDNEEKCVHMDTSTENVTSA